MYVVIGARLADEYEPFQLKFHGLFPVLAEAEAAVRAYYISVEHGIDAIQDAAVRPEHYEMTIEDVQAVMAEADEAAFQALDGTLTLDGELELLTIVAQEVK